MSIKVKELKEAYEEAVQNKQKSFKFKDEYHLLTAYAKYLIEYLTVILKLKDEDTFNFTKVEEGYAQQEIEKDDS